MGTLVECLVAGEEPTELAPAFAAVEREFERLEAIFSRFRVDSELSRLNLVGVLDTSLDLFRVVQLALEARADSGGVFDPTVHDALVAAGYDRTFDDVRAGRGEPVGPRPARLACAGRVWIDPETRTIELGEDVRLDLGGIAKGDAVDRACDLLEPYGPCLVNAGGDIAVRGKLDGGPWPVGVEVPAGSLSLGLASGALATSGRDRRRWRMDGEERHHLIDPSTGRPAETDLVRVTAFGERATDAEVRAKRLVLAGAEAAVALADAEGIPCVLVTEEQEVVFAGGLAA
jgi:thiamine biosynthesis lipoprotein